MGILKPRLLSGLYNSPSCSSSLSPRAAVAVHKRECESARTVAPGQGAQTPGFLTPWLDLPGAADRLAAWSDAIGLDLARYGTQADADEIRDTAVAQPLLVAAGLLSAAALGDVAELGPGAVAGHSVGEITAAAFAGVLDATAALKLVRTRGLAMAEAAAITETGMSALLGGDPETTVPHLEKLGLTPANVNGGGQIVAA